MALTLCTMCERHVRVTEERCPFCSAEVNARGASEPRRTNATRAMAFAALALTAACDKKKEPPAEAPVTTTTSAAASTSSSVAPIESTSASVADAEAPDAPGTAPGGLHLINVGKPAATTFKKKQPPPPNFAKPYGAPPADGLLS